MPRLNWEFCDKFICMNDVSKIITTMLPSTEGVTSTLLFTGDAFKSSRLERMVKNMTNSYKIYWLKAFVDEVLDGAEHITFKRMSARMVAEAWYPVNYFHLSLGVIDQLGNAVVCCMKQLGLSSSASAGEVIDAIENTDIAVVRKKVDGLCDYVPYRLIRPFYEEKLSAERKQRDGKLPDHIVNSIIIASNRANSNGAPYVFSEDGTAIDVVQDWAEYLRENKQIILGWLDMHLVDYLQARNPSVPAISLKIYPPQKRDLDASIKYWKEALALKPMREIYSGKEFTEQAFDKYGPLSIDHFIPWSFVLHDEPWNLVPMFRNSNSAKNDKLPCLEDFLEPFANQQYEAFMAVRNTGRHRKVLNAYLQIEPQLATFEDIPACKMAFVDDITKAIRPLHQIALNQGFVQWIPTYEYVAMNY
jgi:hypothetical protein